MALFLLRPSVAQASPKAEFSLLNWDFGEIYQWTNPSVNISIKNAGDEELKILDVKKSCGCTATVLSNSVIAPGDKGYLKVSFLSYDMKGAIRKVVRVSTNDPSAPDTVINVTGLVKEDKAAIGSLEPEYIDMGIVAPYETRYFEMMLKNSGNIELSVGGIELPEGYHLDSAYPDKVAARGGSPIRVAYKPAKEKGPIDDVITVKVAGTGQSELRLRMAGYIGRAGSINDSLVLTPAGFRVSPGAGELELTIKNDGGMPVLLEGAESSLDDSETGVSRPKLAPGETGMVRLSIGPGGLEPGTTGYLYLRLAIPISVEEPKAR